MKWFVRLVLILLPTIVNAEECPGLEQAKWAYDTDTSLLRLCIEEGNLLRCTTFPVRVTLEDDSFGYTQNPFRK